MTLADEHTFSRAAEVLNITQPSLSQYIKKIEKEVGMDLFDRSGGEIRLTDAGRTYLEIGRRMLDLDHQLTVQLSDIAENRTGSLSIGAAPYRAASMLPIIAAAFQKSYPGIHLIVHEGTTAELAEGMEHGQYDLAITLLPINQRLFHYEKVVEEELILAVPGNAAAMPSVIMPGRRYPAVEAKVIDGQAMVMLTDTQFMQRQLKDLCIYRDLTVRPAAVVKSLEAQIEFVKAGIGMALMPSGIERFCPEASVRFYSFTDDLPKREVVVMWRKDRNLSKTAAALKEVIHSIKW